MNILIFLNKRLYNLSSFKRFSLNTSLFFPKAIAGLYHKGFQKHARFTICLLVLTVGEFYNISNKNQLPNRSAKYLLFYTKRPYIPPLFSRKINPLHRRVSPKHSLFTIFSLVLRMGQVFNITNKYQFPNQSAKNLYFHPRDFTYPLYISQYTRIQDPVEHLRWIFLRK